MTLVALPRRTRALTTPFVVLAVLAGMGYYYAAQELSWELFQSIYLIFGTLVVFTDGTFEVEIGQEPELGAQAPADVLNVSGTVTFSAVDLPDTDAEITGDDTLLTFVPDQPFDQWGYSQAVQVTLDAGLGLFQPHGRFSTPGTVTTCTLSSRNSDSRVESLS